jgi:hypothetical protein
MSSKYIHTYTCLNINITHIRTYSHSVSIPSTCQASTCMHIQTHTYIHTAGRFLLPRHVKRVHAYVYKQTHTHTHAHSRPVSTPSTCQASTCMHIQTHTHARTHTAGRFLLPRHVQRVFTACAQERAEKDRRGAR